MKDQAMADQKRLLKKVKVGLAQFVDMEYSTSDDVDADTMAKWAIGLNRLASTSANFKIS
jgi:hypothetical protein